MTEEGDHILPAAKARRLAPDIIQQRFVAGVTMRLGKLDVSLTKRLLGPPNELSAELLVADEMLTVHKTAS